MYYVYKVSFETYNAVYVGCTNDIRRRRHQHNGNARTGKSFFGRFLNSCGIILKEGDLEVIAQYDDRPSALERERNETKALIGTGVLILNEVNSDHYKRSGIRGAENPSSKTYVVVDMQEHTYEVVDSMHAWCDEHAGVAYTTLIGTVNRTPHVHRNRYIARTIEEWEGLSEEERLDLVSGKWYSDHMERNRVEHIARASKKYLVQTPDGNTVTVVNLDKYARDNGINAGNLHASLSNGRSASGYRVLKRLT